MTNMKPPQEGRNTGAASLRGLLGRSATGLNGQAAKEEVSVLWRGGWMPENISGVSAGRSVFHLTSPLIGLLARVRWSTPKHTFSPSSAQNRTSIGFSSFQEQIPGSSTERVGSMVLGSFP